MGAIASVGAKWEVAATAQIVDPCPMILRMKVLDTVMRSEQLGMYLSLAENQRKVVMDCIFFSPLTLLSLTIPLAGCCVSSLPLSLLFSYSFIPLLIVSNFYPTVNSYPVSSYSSLSIDLVRKRSPGA